MWWMIAVVVIACWALLPFPLAVAVGRSFAAAELTEEPEPQEFERV